MIPAGREYPPTNGFNRVPGVVPASYAQETTPQTPAENEQGWMTPRMSKEWQRRLLWIVPLVVAAVALVILFEVYKTSFERWLSPLSNWLEARKAWSWVIPVGVLILLSFPPLFGHEIVLLIVGLAYSLGIGIGIACAGAVLGEASVFLVCKYAASSFVARKIARNVKWAATARVAQDSGFKGVLLIRYSIVPPHLANPIFATTGMTWSLYMGTVIISLPKTIIFVALGNPNNKGKHGVTAAKVIAFGVVGLVSLYATLYIRKHIRIARQEIEVEHANTSVTRRLDDYGSR